MSVRASGVVVLVVFDSVRGQIPYHLQGMCAVTTTRHSIPTATPTSLQNTRSRATLPTPRAMKSKHPPPKYLTPKATFVGQAWPYRRGVLFFAQLGAV